MKIRKFFSMLTCVALSLLCFACGNGDKNYTIEPGTQSVTLAMFDGANSANISVTVTDANGKEQPKAKITYTSANDGVATVSADGKVTAVSAGRTSITAKYKSVSADIAVEVLGTATAEQVNTFDSKYVNTYGRVFTEGGKLNVHQVTSGVEVSFYGTELTADIDVTNIRNKEDHDFDSARARVFVDGDTEGIFTKLETQKNFKLVSGLDKGLHTVRILKASELIDSVYTVSNLSAEAFAVPPAKPDLKLEFIGDSITAGFGVFGKLGELRTMDNSDGCKTYAYLTAQKLGAEVSVVAVSGICVKVEHDVTLKMADMYPYYSPYTEPPVDYDFNDGVDVVVLNLGSNDSAYMEQSAVNAQYRKQFLEDYTNFLSYIRSKRPDAYIVCVYGSCTFDARTDKNIDTAIESLGDAKISRMTNVDKNQQAAHSHPNLASQEKNARALAEYIRQLVK